MVTTKMSWSGPNVIHFGRKSQFGPDQFILVVTISFCLWPFHFGWDQIILVKSKSIWSDQNSFGHIEGQGISVQFTNLAKRGNKHCRTFVEGMDLSRIYLAVQCSCHHLCNWYPFMGLQLYWVQNWKTKFCTIWPIYWFHSMFWPILWCFMYLWVWWLENGQQVQMGFHLWDG